jgi:hypothetical protein
LGKKTREIRKMGKTGKIAFFSKYMFEKHIKSLKNK